MKANEVPEKLYCCYKGNGDLFVDCRPFPNDDNIEYIKKDAFIEKACDWLEKNGCGYWLDDSALPNRDLIDEFRKYMEE